MRWHLERLVAKASYTSMDRSADRSMAAGRMRRRGMAKRCAETPIESCRWLAVVVVLQGSHCRHIRM